MGLKGGEITLILPVVEKPADAVTEAEKILAAFSLPFRVAREERATGTSIGTGVFPEAGLSMAERLHCADSAMYEAKDGGKNRWVLYKPDES